MFRSQSSVMLLLIPPCSCSVKLDLLGEINCCALLIETDESQIMSISFLFPESDKGLLNRVKPPNIKNVKAWVMNWCMFKGTSGQAKKTFPC